MGTIDYLKVRNDYDTSGLTSLPAWFVVSMSVSSRVMNFFSGFIFVYWVNLNHPPSPQSLLRYD